MVGGACMRIGVVCMVTGTSVRVRVECAGIMRGWGWCKGGSGVAGGRLMWWTGMV